MDNDGRARTELPLTSLRSLPLKDQVVRQLTDLIEGGALPVGAQLPSERELAAQLQVSRSTVREAVQFLESLGVVEIRHGAGTFVRAGGGAARELQEEWREWVSRHTRRIRELLEVRRGLETFAAELACQNATEDGLRAARAALEQAAEAVDDDDVPTLVQADVRFHGAIAEATGNVALADLLTAIGAQLMRERAATLGVAGRPHRSQLEHTEIFEALQARDVERARAAVLAHLQSIEDDVGGLVAEHEHQRDGREGEPTSAQTRRARKGRGNVR